MRAQKEKMPGRDGRRGQTRREQARSGTVARMKSVEGPLGQSLQELALDTKNVLEGIDLIRKQPSTVRPP